MIYSTITRPWPHPTPHARDWHQTTFIQKFFSFWIQQKKCGGWQTPQNPDDLALVSGNTDNLANNISIQSCPPRSDSAVSTEGRCAKCHSQDLNRLVCFKKEVAHLFRESLVKMPSKIMTREYLSDLSRIFVQSSNMKTPPSCVCSLFFPNAMNGASSSSTFSDFPPLFYIRPQSGVD